MGLLGTQTSALVAAIAPLAPLADLIDEGGGGKGGIKSANKPGGIKGVAGGPPEIAGLTINAADAKKENEKRRREAAKRAGREGDARQRNADIIAGIGGTDYGPGEEMGREMYAAEYEGGERQAAAELEYKRSLQEGVTEIAETNARRRMSIYEMEAKAQAESYNETLSNLQAGISIAGGAVMGLFEDLISGDDDAGLKFAKSMLMGIGQTLFQKGTADMAAAVASGLIYGNWTGVGAASAEMAIGAGLMAGGAGVGKAISNNEEGREAAEKSKASKGSSSFAGSAGYSGGGSSDSGGSQTIVVNLQGPVYDGAAAGVAIMQKINEARRQGVLK